MTELGKRTRYITSITGSGSASQAPVTESRLRSRLNVGECNMPITPFLKDVVFDPDTTRAMGVAFEDACHVLGLSDRTDPLTEIVAKKIIECAVLGEHDPVRLRDLVIKELKS
jgi:hypothetical protein